MNYLKIKKSLIILMFVVAQAVPLQAMLLPTMRTALSVAGRKTLSSLAEQPLPAYVQTPEQMAFIASGCLPSTEFTDPSDDTQKKSRLGVVCVAGSVITAAALVFSDQKTDSLEEKIETLYGPEFLRKAGFAEGLPYWYLAQFATKFAHVALNNDLSLKIELSEQIVTYQPDYLSLFELTPVWNGTQWQLSKGPIKDSVTGIGGIKITLSDKNDAEIASCYLTAAGTVNGVKVNKNYRGKGYGSLLLSVTKQIAFEAGIYRLHLHVWPYDLPDTMSRQDAWESTVRFYKKNGFSPDRMFRFECAESNLNVDFSRMVCDVSGERIDGCCVHECAYCNREQAKVKLAIGICAMATVGVVWWSCSTIKSLL